MGTAMLGPGRMGTRGILRGLNQARDGRHLSVLASQATQASRSPGLPSASLLYQNPVVRRSIFTTRVLGEEVKVIVCPAFADSISEGDIRWEKAVGDSVSEDEVLCEIETDKTSVPVPSPGSGVITELLVEDGSTVQPGVQLLKIQLGPGGAKPAAAPAAAAPAPAAAAPPLSITFLPKNCHPPVLVAGHHHSSVFEPSFEPSLPWSKFPTPASSPKQQAGANFTCVFNI